MRIAFGAAKGLAFLHDAEKPVIYRDFKTSNILLDPVSLLQCLLSIDFCRSYLKLYVIKLQDFNAKLSDFGLAKDGPVGDKSHVSTRIMGTYGYAAPEYIMTGNFTFNSCLSVTHFESCIVFCRAFNSEKRCVQLRSCSS